MNTFKASDFDDLFGITPEQRTSVSQQSTDTQTTQLPAAEQQSFKVNPSAIKASDFDDILGITPDDRISTIQKQKAIAEDSSDFIAGTKRGVQNLQASLWGAAGLVGKGLQSIGAEETGKKLQDFGFEGYRRNTAEAAQTPAKYSFKDIYTGKAGVGGAIDWAQGTLGELVPSMVEAATGAVIGAAAGSIIPGAGTVGGALTGLAGRTVLKKSIDQAVGKLVKEGADAAVANQVRKQVTAQALKKLGGKVGMGTAIMPMEAGGMYGELFESHGVDAPETALLFGALATSLEFLGGNSKLVDVFVDSLAKGAKGTAKKSAKEILSNIPEEALQEGGQELMNILNTVVNTDEKLLTLDNVERIVESMAAGAVGGSFGSAANVVMDGKQLNKPSELDQKVDNIASGGVENIQKALNEFDRQDAFNIELLNNPEKLAAQAAEFGVTPERLSDNIGSQIMANKQLRERLNIELAKPVEEVKKEEPLTDDALKARIEDARKNHDVLVAEQKNREQKINNFNNQVNQLNNILTTTTDNNRKNSLREQISGIIKSRNELVGQTEIVNQEIKAYREFGAPKKSDELYAEKQRLYESIWTDRDKGVSPEEGIPIGIQPSYTDPEKSAVVSGAIINENYPQIEQKLIQLREDIANEYDYERRREMQKTYDELFVDYEQKKSAAESVNVFEKAGIDRGQVADLHDVEQVPLTDQQQVIVDQNNLKINDLNNQLNRTIDRDERISLLQQIDELDKVNAEIRTPIENVSQVGNELLGTDETSAFKNEQQVGTPEIDNNQYTEEPINLETRSNIRQTKKLSLADISKIFPNQEVSQDESGKISVRFKNGKGATFQSIKDAGQGYIKFAIETGQMSKNGKILGITVGSDVLLDANFADNQTLWHENKHVLDNLGLITKEDDSLLNAEFNRLRNANKLRFSLSTHEDPRQRMIENRANTFAQIMLDREAYRNKPLGKTIQRILDFFQQLLSLGQQSVAGFAREVESGKIYERQAIEGDINDRLNADHIATTPEQIAQTIHPAIMYDGLMKGIPGVVDDLHNFTITLPDGKQPSFSITGEVTADKVSEQLNKLMKRFGQDPNFEVRDFTVPEQKLSDEQYNESFRHQNNLLQDVKQIFRMRLHDVKLLVDKSMGSISTRLKNVSPLLSSKLRILDFTTSQKIVKALREAKPILEATKGMSKEDKFVWDLARKNADAGKVQQLATKYGILENVQTLRNTLNNIRKEAEEVGYDVGFLDEYWPRIIKDTEGFLQATQEISEQPVFSNAIKEKAKAMGLTVEQFNNEYPEVKADIISNLILGRGMGIGGPGNIQSRVYDTIPRELEQYYMDSDAALMQYIYSMTKKIEVRKFFGKVPERIMKLKTAKKNKQTELIKLQELARLNPAEAEINAEKIEQLQEDIARIDEPLEQYKHRRDYTENIGTYIDDLMMARILKKKDEKMVRDILDARFHEYGTHGPINAYKNFSYIDVMGSPISAITQIGDLAWAMYVGKVWTPSGFSNTIKNIINAAFNKSNITKEDLGIERIAQEFADGTTLSNAVSWVFNKTLLSKIDSIGKEALINNALDQYKRQVQSEAGRTKLISDIRAIFGPQSESVIQDLLTNNNSDNVKMLLYSRLLDFQPVALSEMPEYYLKAGNGRVFYMLKTYTLKQMDVFRKEVWHTIKNGDAQQKLEGIKNLVQLMSLLTLANASADEIKDWLLGKESKFKDHVIENFLTMGGASRYIRMQTTQDGLGSTLAGKILPPFKFINSLSKDIIQGYKDYVSGDTSNLTDSRVLESVPIAGKLLYWHMGRGAEYKESIAEQEFKKAGKAANLFKKQLENSKDKRLFLQANLNDFRQMKLHENSQSSLNKIQATINKLEKIEQTTNVVKRIGQLNNHKERIMIDYLKRTEGLTAQ